VGFHVGAEIASQGEAFVAQFAGVRLVTCRPINQSGYVCDGGHSGQEEKGDTHVHEKQNRIF
jgi:hypothetical protein